MFFVCKLHFLRAWGLFLSKKITIFWFFFIENVGWRWRRSRQLVSARSAPSEAKPCGEAGGHQPLYLSIASARSARARTSKRWVPASFSFDSERAKRASPNQKTVGSKRMQQPECTSRYTPNRNRPLPAGCEWKSESEVKSESEWWVFGPLIFLKLLYVLGMS